ncbi:Zn-dependent M28 family amino/carboxypeptidase [Sphingomonas kyeonggiensis]|uniref:Zn-dependent M28 family amino/carboxypeptidase n=1 Tax=Sphingomonas kyeonggiensis TaxID=1268553 RepID=A0A7W7K0B7_9SPHN|nr:M20/M25/M40 family metallo-hydrolase [Sphingomonas kyeonggiensis]MBB4838332.1 Zn-dependent M28 family amino/carboxypeptidase [Sphingomonas kyeonggiensis]
MRLKPLIAALSLGLAPAVAWAQSEPVFSPDEVRAHVEFLADDLLGGRDNGTEGFDIAARYVSSRFDAMGFKPGGTQGWYQPVNIADYVLDAEKPASATIGTKKFAGGEDVLFGPSPLYGDETQTLTADAVFVGHGREEDYAGLDVTGKFVVTLLGNPPGAAPGKIDKPGIAGKHGALGMIYLVTPENLKGAFPWAQAISYFQMPQSNWLDARGFPKGEDPGLKIGAYVKGLAADALFKGAPTSAAQLYATLAKPDAAPASFALKQKVTLQRTSVVTLKKSNNVIGILPGSDPKLANEYVVLSAHLDHEGTQLDVEGEDKIFNGAMDNAAGVASMLEAARAFTQSGKRPRRSILFVALTAEEDGLIGSEYLARYPVVGSGKVVADVNLDMPILLYDFQDVVAFGAEHSTLGPIVERAAAKMGVTLSPDPMPEEQLFLRSDHYSFVKAGVPSVFLVTGFKNGGEKAFRDFLKTNYHKVSDDIRQPFDWKAGAKFAKINYLIAREIADADQEPRWYVGNSFGERFAKDAPKAPRPAGAPAAAPARSPAVITIPVPAPKKN